MFITGSAREIADHWVAIGPCLTALVLATLVACTSPKASQEIGLEEQATPAGEGRLLTIGDIDPDTPAHRIRRIKPLADALANQLGESGIGGGRVVIARDIDEMAKMLMDGTVDLYIDSTFPSISVRSIAASEIILAGSIKGFFEYSGIFVTARNEVTSLEDLRGQVVAFEEQHSTSGYLLPYAALLAKGLTPEKIERPEAVVDPDHVGYYFSGDEENSLVLALDGTVAAAAVSTSDWDELPAAHRDQMRIVARTSSVPRQLVSLRPGIEGPLRTRLKEVLMDLPSGPLEDHPEAWVWSFKEMSEGTRESLARVEGLANSIPGSR